MKVPFVKCTLRNFSNTTQWRNFPEYLLKAQGMEVESGNYLSFTPH